MTRQLYKTLISATILSVAAVGVANAGGFSRGKADTSIIYEDAGFNMRSSVTFVDVHKEYSKAANPAAVGEDFADSYVIPSAAVKLNILDSVRCAGTYTQAYGGSFTVSELSNFYGKTHEAFTIDEFGATCGVKFDVGPGRAWLIAGGFQESFSYDRKEDFSFIANTPVFGPLTVMDLGPPVRPVGPAGAENPALDTGYMGTLSLEGRDYGFRLGAAYEIPEYALRAEILYRSATSHRPDGELTVPAGVLCIKGTPGTCGLPRNFAVPIAATGAGELPQSVELNLQSGIAPGWLAFGSVKWMDWSVTKSLDVNNAVTGANISKDLFNWRDGWTVTGGVGHAFNESVSGLVSVTWDRGVGTGFDMSGDTWTLAVGGSVKDKIGGELRAGVGFSYLAASAETQYGLDPIYGFDTNRASKAGYAIAGSVGYSIKW